MKVSQVAEQFFIHGRLDRQYAPETRQKVQECFACWVLPFLGDHELSEVSMQQVFQIRHAMLQRGLSIARISSVLASIKAFLGFCRSALKLDCMNPAEIRLPRREKPNVQFLTPEEVERVVSTLNPHRFADVRLRALCELILGTGMRLGEALRMDRTPFDQKQTELDIIGKGGKVRTVFLSERCCFWVKQYLNARFDDHPALFITTGSPPRRWARGDVSRFFIELRRKAGIQKKLTPHLLRHTYCTTLLNNGVDITFIKELAGHENIQTTARYYLGVDKPALRRIVKERLHYSAADSAYATLDNKAAMP